MPRTLRTALAALGAAAVLTSPLPASAAVAPADAPPGGLRTAALPAETLVSAAGEVVTPERAARTLAADGNRVRHDGFAGLGKVPAAADTNSIIGTDTRAQITATTSYPARAIGLINRNGSAWCTAWLISDDTALTAGHCVHSGGTGGSWYDGLTFLAGSNGGNAPYGTCRPRERWALNGWLTGSTVTTRRENDAAILKLDCTVGFRTGWFGMWWQTASLNGLTTRVQGYPGDKPSTQWRSVDYVRASDARRVYYKNDTVGGMSGSPVYQNRSSSAAYCSGTCAMAIHAYGLIPGDGSAATNNSGPRITEGKFATFMSIVNRP